MLNCLKIGIGKKLCLNLFWEKFIIKVIIILGIFKFLGNDSLFISLSLYNSLYFRDFRI